MSPKKSTHFWNTLDMQIVESAANTLTELQIATGVSPATKSVMVLKKIIASINGMDIGPAPGVGVLFALICNLNTQQGLTTMPGLQANGTIWYHAPLAEMGGDGATAAEAPGFVSYPGGFPPYVEFDDPIPVVDDTLSLYIQGTGLASAVTLGLKLYYRVESVSLEEALTILESYR